MFSWFRFQGIKAWLPLFAITVTAAAVAAGGVQFAAMTAQKMFRPAADRVASAVASDGTQSYIVQFDVAPMARYARSTGIMAMDSTLPGRAWLNVHTATVQAYVAQLDAQHAQFLSRASALLDRSLTPRFEYHYALNGMAVRLTAAEARRLRTLTGVKSVELDRAYKPVGYSVPIPGSATNTLPSRTWIGADQVWALSTFNTGAGNDNEGEGVVVADLDTGINAANSSFAATGPDGYAIANPRGSGNYLGVCDPTNAMDGTLAPGAATNSQLFQASFPCNSKLIGAYTYRLDAGNDPNSPEDSEGHGTHTASTAAGNFTRATVAGISFNISGMAPHANLIAYDVCDPTNGCWQSASIAAVDQAIQDYSTLKNADPAGFKGMVINYSIGGSDDPYTDPVDQAFESAEQAGIFVSAAAANGGPANPANSQYPVQHLAPWIMTVAAGTHDGQFSPNTLENFSGGTTPAPPAGSISGQGETGGVGPVQIVYAGACKNGTTPPPGGGGCATPTYSDPVVTGTAPISGQPYPPSTGRVQQDAALCLYPFPANTFPAGAIVVCDRGIEALVDKAYNVRQGGAGGVVIATTTTSSQDMVAEQYVIPGILVVQSDGATLETWINGNTDNQATPPVLQAQLSGATYSSGNSSAADYLAGFSSRGPVGTYPGTPSAFDSLIKPDVMAPGVNVLAAYADPCYTVTPSTCPDGQQETFTLLDGTSMATPHDTGAGALLMELHPSWDPMAIKSALMTTAVPDDQLHDQCDAANAIANGCTITEPDPPTPQAVGAGRIQVPVAARAGFVLEETQADFNADNPDTGGDITKINEPSLANANCQVSCTWTRAITSAQAGPLDYAVASTQPWLSIQPTSFTLAAGGTQTLTFTANVSGLAVNQWAFARVDFTTSSNESDGKPAPTQHFPVAVFDAQPQPIMKVTPAAMTQALTAGGSSQTQSLTISNTGAGALDWTVNNIATSTTDVARVLRNMNGRNAEPRGSGNPVPIVNRPSDNSGYGFPSDVFTGSGHGIYFADTFNMPVEGNVTNINALGFAQAGQSAGAVTDATQIAWYVYADANGEPAGNPEDGKNDYLWTFTAVPAAPGVDTTNNNINLDLATAGAPLLSLAAGKYWLTVVPTFNDTFESDHSMEAWYWYESAAGGGSGSLIDPGKLLGEAALIDWALIGPNTQVNKNATGSVSLAFELLGTLNCSGSNGSGIPGLSLNASSGTVAANSTGTVIARFNPASLAAGSYSGVLCVQGNDPNTPFVIVPVTEKVASAPTPPPSSGGGSGGGGGGLGLLSLMMLGLLGMRRRHYG